jgi:thiamine-phosphate pyrophosphorylase
MDPPRKAPHRLLLCYITNRKQFPGSARAQEDRLIEKMAESAAAGVDFIQLREKDLSPRELERLAGKAMAALPRGSITKLLINSRIDVALACGAHGVHLPAGFLSPSEARSSFARAGIGAPIVAISTHSVAEVHSAEAHGADFAIFGPVFEKAGVANRSGLEQLAAVAARLPASSSPMPVLALGGVTVKNAQACLQAGVAGLAGIRLFQDADAGRSVSQLRSLWKAGGAARS